LPIRFHETRDVVQLNQMKNAPPECGRRNDPQYRLSSLRSRLSPIMKCDPKGLQTTAPSDCQSRSFPCRRTDAPPGADRGHRRVGDFVLLRPIAGSRRLDTARKRFVAQSLRIAVDIDLTGHGTRSMTASVGNGIAGDATTRLMKSHGTGSAGGTTTSPLRSSSAMIFCSMIGSRMP
jgi:hypothetical protein